MRAETKRGIDARLRRIAGQVGGIQRMLQEDRYCVDILLQIAAARAALDRAGRLLLASHVETCVAAAFASGRPRERKQKMKELLDVLSRLAPAGSG
ncbi:MAG: metal-sensitive transcriptional regulator [Myxococcales bacterium]|nr:metal-sensitive transcriptional regulator [Myxococcales bacterium]MDH5306892.1 metal-sensitive transcriptional regulator [Myxococcales bacterium]MDH5566581.1 metal-sensitive transcriptional regulator [Myxococcales bacterium]